ncbi:hypothetical protein [Algisphaera agarilytica]|uniref:Uncharacterized protein n=1 Tax=Algisphaera agarilytica TaxID=1385975 RepID=A0A7X0LMR9_9BACT|nr:hypothetical protein [Algisphaera agarilytica]MBB6431313.1 hypothetical protein [Algisphaera agarilytica]
MNQSLDDLMQNASQLLTDMDYLGSEALCLEALALAKEAGDWTAYARIVLPLQECRRQRRLTAADTAVQLGTNACWNDPRDGCVAVTKPLDRSAAEGIARSALEYKRQVEVLWCDNETREDTWTLATLGDIQVRCSVPAPDADWVNQRLSPGDDGFAAAGHWFIAASEALGDAALHQIEAPLGSLDRVEQLEAMLAMVGDHEILHQRLADAARAMPLGQPT